MKNLRGRNAIVTGASFGIGVHVARALAREGVNLALVARSRTELEAVADEARATGVRAVALPTDLGLPAERDALVPRAEAELGPIDLLVNNAGMEKASWYTDLSPADIRAMIEVNLVAPMMLTHQLLPGMLARGAGHVVNVSSLGGKSGTPFNEPYCATKFGLVGFTQSLQATYVDGPVGFSVVCPGFVTGEGMFARAEAMGVAAPASFGASSPGEVGAAVVRAVVEELAEVIVTPHPVRPALAIGVLLPSLLARGASLSGVRAVFQRVADLRRAAMTEPAKR